MNRSPENFDATWERLYLEGGRHRNRYPFDSVVQFVFRHRPMDVPIGDICIFEVGCGAGNNLWFAAREGFQVTGVDASKKAIELARNRFDQDGLRGDLRVCDAVDLPFDDGVFDMAIDRAALTHMPKSALTRSIGEIRRILKPGGIFHFNPFSEGCTSAQPGAHSAADIGGTLTDITEGTLAGAGLACVYNGPEIEALFAHGWDLFSLRRVRYEEMKAQPGTVHEEWIALAKKTK